MTLAALLDALNARGIRLAATADGLRYWPASAVPPELVVALQVHTPALRAVLVALGPILSLFDGDVVSMRRSWQARVSDQAGVGPERLITIDKPSYLRRPMPTDADR